MKNVYAMRFEEETAVFYTYYVWEFDRKMLYNVLFNLYSLPICVFLHIFRVVTENEHIASSLVETTYGIIF